MLPFRFRLLQIVSSSLFRRLLLGIGGHRRGSGTISDGGGGAGYIATEEAQDSGNIDRFSPVCLKSPSECR